MIMGMTGLNTLRKSQFFWVSIGVNSQHSVDNENCQHSVDI